eukprot:81931-Chlamydomonas_euryale.AAC.1
MYGVSCARKEGNEVGVQSAPMCGWAGGRKWCTPAGERAGNRRVCVGGRQGDTLGAIKSRHADGCCKAACPACPTTCSRRGPQTPLKQAW